MPIFRAVPMQLALHGQIIQLRMCLFLSRVKFWKVDKVCLCVPDAMGKTAVWAGGDGRKCIYSIVYEKVAVERCAYWITMLKDAWCIFSNKIFRTVMD